MRSCRHCAHENADHLAFCSQCGHKLPRTDGRCRSQPPHDRAIPAAIRGRCWRRRGPHRRRDGTDGRARTRFAMSPTTLSSVAWAAPPAAAPSRVRWLGESIGYIYVYLRSKLDAGEHRRRLLEERTGAEALLAGALNELGQIVLREGVQHARADRTARGDRPGARAPRGGGRRRGHVGVSAAERGDAARQPAVGRRGGMGRRRQRQPRVRADPARGDRRSPHGGHAARARPGRARPDRTRHQRRERSRRRRPAGTARARRRRARGRAARAGRERRAARSRSSPTCATSRPRCATPPQRRSRSSIRSSRDAARRRRRWRRASRDGCAIASTPSARSPT